MAGSRHAGVDLDLQTDERQRVKCQPIVSRLFSLTSEDGAEDGDEDDGDDDGGAEGAAGAWEVRGWNVGQLDILTMGAQTRRRRSEKRSPFVSFCENLDVFLLWRRSLGSEA